MLTTAEGSDSWAANSHEAHHVVIRKTHTTCSPDSALWLHMIEPIADQTILTASVLSMYWLLSSSFLPLQHSNLQIMYVYQLCMSSRDELRYRGRHSQVICKNVNTVAFFLEDLSTCRFQSPQRSCNPCPMDIGATILGLWRGKDKEGRMWGQRRQSVQACI